MVRHRLHDGRSRIEAVGLVVVGEKQWSCSMATIDVRLVSSVDIRNLEAGEAVRFSHAEKFPISGPLSTFQHTTDGPC